MIYLWECVSVTAGDESCNPATPQREDRQGFLQRSGSFCPHTHNAVNGPPHSNCTNKLLWPCMLLCLGLLHYPIGWGYVCTTLLWFYFFMFSNALSMSFLQYEPVRWANDCDWSIFMTIHSACPCSFTVTSQMWVCTDEGLLRSHSGSSVHCLHSRARLYIAERYPV